MKFWWRRSTSVHRAQIYLPTTRTVGEAVLLNENSILGKWGGQGNSGFVPVQIIKSKSYIYRRTWAFRACEDRSSSLLDERVFLQRHRLHILSACSISASGTEIGHLISFFCVVREVRPLSRCNRSRFWANSVSTSPIRANFWSSD